ncbi:MAG TPA: branched-chain amino acid ABC transporter permease [Rhodospirillales bacterium]|nr:branched-chain amino acid ABC transporter permease [Rhodospirillales bacterium]
MAADFRLLPLFGLIALVPWLVPNDYYLHIAVLMLIWSFAYTGWSLMGRFFLVSLGHGGFMGIGAYGTVMLWNHFGLTPWVGIPASLAATALLAVVLGYPCFRFRITGHYFALVTLAFAEIVRLVIVALRDYTGGSLGVTPVTALAEGGGWSLWALQFAAKEVWFYIAFALWLGGLAVWRAIDRSMLRYALEAGSQDEDAAASIGVDVTRSKLAVTVVSATMTALAGALYAQYQLYINPETVSGIAISLQIVFAVIAGGMFVRFGPTVGAVVTLLLTETLRILVGHDIHGLDGTIYGLMLILFIIFMPDGILGKLLELARRGRRTAVSER